MSTSTERLDLCGTTLDGRYRLSRRIGVGGTGVVFEARNLASGMAVAVKTLRPRYVEHIDLGRRLRREAEVGARVRHPGIVATLDQGVLRDGSPYLVMPLLHGEGLDQVLQQRRCLPADEVAVIASRVAAILHSAHCAGYVHRDVKPEHILLSRSQEGDLSVQLLDFGVCASTAAPLDERRREQGKVFGTPTYVSPEQAAGSNQVDARADLFGMGIVMFEALTGKLPFVAPTVSKLLLRIMREQAPALREVAPHADACMEALVARLLARDVSERLPSARALSRALAPHIGDRKSVEHRVAARVSRFGLLGTVPTRAA